MTTGPTTAAEAFASERLEVSERFLGAAYQACWPGGAALLRKYGIALDFELDERHFPCLDHWAIYAALAAHAQRRKFPTRRSLKLAAEAYGFVSAAANPHDDLIRRLPYIEVTPAGIARYGALLHNYQRRAALAQRLHETHFALLDPFSPTSETATELTKTIEAWQADGADAPELPQLARPVVIPVSQGRRLNDARLRKGKAIKGAKVFTAPNARRLCSCD